MLFVKLVYTFDLTGINEVKTLDLVQRNCLYIKLLIWLSI